MPGRGGAGFPFARKVRTALASGRRRARRGQRRARASRPAQGLRAASSPRRTSCSTAPRPWRRALGAPGVHVVVGQDRPAARARASRTRSPNAIRPDPGRGAHAAFAGSSGGQETAVLELLDGRENLPVTAWQPAAVTGLRGRPTLVSNAETFAQVAALLTLGPAAYAELGTPRAGDDAAHRGGRRSDGVVLEVPHGVGLGQVLEFCGYDPSSADAARRLPRHLGCRRARRRGCPVSLAAPRAGLSLGAGVVLPLDAAHLPRRRHRRRHRLPGEHGRRPVRARASTVCPRSPTPSARSRTGPGRSATRRGPGADALVPGRGACAHPDGTARLVASMLAAFPTRSAGTSSAAARSADAAHPRARHRPARRELR